MKTLLIALSAVSLLALGTSCRVASPVNPNTGKQDPSMVPAGNGPFGWSKPGPAEGTEVKPSK